MADAAGVVTLDGNPLPDAIVSFTPVNSGKPSQAISNASGEFELGTFELGDGALVGEHNVAINPLNPPPPSYMVNPNQAGGYKPPFPSVYWSPKSSGLTATVVAGESNEYTFDLKSKP